MKKRYTIVELCLASHPAAKKIIDANKDLGHQVYRYRGVILLILNDYEFVWRAPDAIFAPLGAGTYQLEPIQSEE
jgi:hypothetical protein